MHFMIACSILFSLSMTTKMEMRRIFPYAAEYCLAHPNGTLSVKINGIDPSKKEE